MMRQREVSQTHTSDGLCELENKLRKLKKKVRRNKVHYGSDKGGTVIKWLDAIKEAVLVSVQVAIASA